MKSNTTKDYFYTGDYYSYTRTLNPDGVTYTKTYSFNRNVSMSITVNLLGELVITSPDKMQKEGNILNIRDANGEEIYTGGQWTISQTAPVLGPMGLKGGYRYRATLIAGDI